MELTVAEVVELINEIRPEPKNLFEMIRTKVQDVTTDGKCLQNTGIKCPPTRAFWRTFRRTTIQLEVPYAREGGLDDYQSTG
jgi:hypothetical protein